MANERARSLRRQPTTAEARLWSALRRRQIEGRRFRRQHPLGPFVVDSVCLERRLVVEIDGGQHADAVEYDAERTRWLESRGYRVLRFWNNEVLENLEGVLWTIQSIADIGPPHPSPPPPGGRE